MREKSEKRAKRSRDWATYLLALAVAVTLLMAHLSRGADTPDQNLPIAFASIALFVFANLATRFRDINLAMASLALLFVVWFALGMFGPVSQAGHEILSLATAGTLLGCGFLIGRQSEAMSWAWSCLVWTLLLLVTLALLSYLSTRLGFDFTAGFGSSNTAATLIGISLLIAGAKLAHRLQDRRMGQLTRTQRVNRLAQKEFPSLVLLILGSIALVLTVSRAGIFISLAVLALLIGYELRRASRVGRFRFLRRKRIWVPASFVIGALLLLAITGEINPNDSELLLANSASRLQMFETYAGIWLEKPWFGHGLGSFNELNDRATTLQNAAVFVPNGAAHNVILQWLMQQGLVGLVMMIIVFGVIFYPILKSLSSPAKTPRLFLRLSIAVTVLVFAHGMVDFALEIPSVMWTYAYILGLAAGFATTTGRAASKPVE